MASGRIHPLRVLHHVPHRPQHHPPHDEGRPGLLYTALPACLHTVTAVKGPKKNFVAKFVTEKSYDIVAVAVQQFNPMNGSL